jgi:hypothetical protein
VGHEKVFILAQKQSMFDRNKKNARWSKLWTCCLGGGKATIFFFKTIFKLLIHLSTIEHNFLR